MEVIIHRGTHQIGGCATEYRTKNARIFIDFGAELDNENAKPFDIEGVTKGKTNCDAVFFTHYHGDHMGLLDTINEDIPLYMGEASKTISQILNDRLSKAPNIDSYDPERINSIKTFEAAKAIVIGDIKITPYMVDHSAYDAYMFKIEADGKSVLHTGDFRTHGFRGKGVKPTLEKYVKKVDVLVCEGTTVNRTEAKCETENDLKNRIKTVLQENKYVFVVCSSTNIDRLAGICSVIPEGKYCICDKYQLSVIQYIRDYAGDKSSLYKFRKALYYSENLDEKMNDNGFCMFVRCGNPEHKRIMEMYKDKNPVVIYSMWKGYLEQDNIKEFLDGYKRLDMHTSGHADSDAIKMVIDTVQPDMIIPMHTEVPEAFLNLTGNRKVILAHDEEIIKVEEEIMGRTISPTFAEDINHGVLTDLLDIIKNDNELIICFRKDYANVYYKSHSVFKIEEQATKYKFTFNLGHARYVDTFERIENEVEKYGIETKRSGDGEEDRHSYNAVFSVKKNGESNVDFNSIINIYKRYIDDFFQGGPRKDLFENENRNTNSLREKRHQQVLFSEHLDVTGELLFYDMELSLPKPKEKSNEMKAIVKEIGKHVTGAPDCLAVRLKKGVVTKIVLVEVKSTREACTGDHGIKKHDEDFNKIIECSYYREFIAESMKETLKLYGENGICENIDIPDALGEKKDDFEILYFFTHDDVKNWVDNSGYDTTGNKSKYEELYNSNPDMFRFVNDDMKHLMGKEYN